MDEAAANTGQSIDQASFLKDIENVFSARLQPLLDSVQSLESIVKGLSAADLQIRSSSKESTTTPHRREKDKSPKKGSHHPKHDGSSSRAVCEALGLADSVGIGIDLEDEVDEITQSMCDRPPDTVNTSATDINNISVEMEDIYPSENIEKQLPDSGTETLDIGSENPGLNSTQTPRMSSRKKRSSDHLVGGKMMVQREMAALGANHVKKHSRIVDMALHALAWSHSIKEPPRSGRAYRIVTSRKFENLCMSVIFFNSSFVAYVADWEIQNIGGSKPQSFGILEILFNGFFVLELSVKLAAHGLYYFINADASWNNFDFILVVVAVLDQVLTAVLTSGGGAGNVGFMRILRLMRLAKVFRAFRTVRFFKELSILAESFRRSLITLFWSIMLLTLMVFIFSLIFLQALSDYLKGEGVSAQDVKKVRRYFSGLSRTMLSLYMAVTGGDDWAVFYDLVAATGTFYALVFLMFTFFFMFAMFNILTGMLVEKAVQAAAPDRSDLVLETRAKNREDSEELLRMCKMLDQDGNGTISREEFDNMLENSIFSAYMSSLGLEVSDTDLFFSTIAGSSVDDEITLDDFAHACVHMRGNATGVDMKRQLLETSTVLEHLQSCDQKNRQTLRNLEALNCRMSTMLSHVSTASELAKDTSNPDSKFTL